MRKHHPFKKLPSLRRFKQWCGIQFIQNPSGMVLLAIVLVNVAFFLIAAAVIAALAPPSLDSRGFWASLYYTVTMVMDAGCISYVVESVGTVGVGVIIACIAIVLVGMLIFTGGIIGYITNYISNKIESANSNSRKLNLSDHTVILNWNNRASEIINDLLYSEHPERIVVLVSEDKELVEAEIESRLADTLAKENKLVMDACQESGLLRRWFYHRKHRFRNRLTVIVRQGGTFSAKQLMDISLDRAKAVILLNRDPRHGTCQYATEETLQSRERGNAVTIKTLVLVAEITGSESSADNQKIIVEVEDDWTAYLVDKIIAHKEHLGKCNIIPVSVNKVLGQLLSQFSIMPQLNLVYSELFSNRGAEFYSIEVGDQKEEDILEYLSDHCHAIPLTAMDTKNGRQCFFMADLEHDVDRITQLPVREFHVKGNPDAWQPRRNVLILGHNSKIHALMNGFESYRNEWNPAKDGRDILNIFVVDDAKGLERMDYYQDYPYVSQVIEADLYDRDAIYKAINSFIDDQDGDTGILILSDDAVSTDDLDASALTYLIYVQDILTQRRIKYNGKDTERIDVIIEILNPKNYDVVNSYDVKNVVISNRYISKMITQIGAKEALFEFYSDILTYDQADCTAYESMELYIKRVGDILLEPPGPCTAAELIRAIYVDSKKTFGEHNLTMALGCLDAQDRMTIFSGDQTQIHLDLQPDDKLILFSNH